MSFGMLCIATLRARDQAMLTFWSLRATWSDSCANRFCETGLLCVLVFSLVDQDSVDHVDSEHCVSEVQMLQMYVLEKVPESRSVEQM
jgi:hypothetical protein